MIALGVAAGLAASAAYNGGIVLQALEARDSPRDCAMRLSLLVALCRRRRWLAGVALSILGFPLQIYAYANAPIAVVQTCLAAGLVLVMLCGARVMGEPVRRRDYLAVVAITAGVGLTAVAAPSRSEIERAGSEPVVILIALGALALIPYALSRRGLAPPLVITASAGLGPRLERHRDQAVRQRVRRRGARRRGTLARGDRLLGRGGDRERDVGPTAGAGDQGRPDRVRARDVHPDPRRPAAAEDPPPARPLSQVAFFGGLALVLAAIIVIARSDPVTSVIRQSAEETARARSAGGPGLGFLQLIEFEDLQLTRHRPREQVHRLCDPVVL